MGIDVRGVDTYSLRRILGFGEGRSLMSKKLVRILALIFALSLVISLTGSLGARDPRALERSVPRSGVSLRALPAEIRRTSSSASLWARNYTRFMGSLQAGYVEADNCTSVQPGAGGGIVVAGRASSFKPGTDVGLDWRPFIVELDSSGDVAWMVLFQGDPSKKGRDEVSSLIKTRDGGYLVAGTLGTADPAEYHALVMKLEEVAPAPRQNNDPYHHYYYGGFVSWAKTLGFGSRVSGEYERANAMAETQDGGFVIAGSSSIAGSWIIKLDPLGNPLWQEALVSGFGIYSVAATEDGGFVIAGQSSGYLIVIKFGAAGGIQWQRSYAWVDPAAKCGEFSIVSAACSAAPGGGSILSGYTEYGPSVCHDSSECGWACKLDQSGKLLWQKGFNSFYCYDQFGTPDGGAMVVSDHVAIKLSSDGAKQWQKSYQDIFLTCGYQVDDGGYVLGGQYWLPDPTFQDRIAVVRLDPAGNIGPDCSAVTGINVTERKGALTAVSLSPLSISYPTIWMKILENNSQARPCQIQMICGQDLSLRQRR